MVGDGRLYLVEQIAVQVGHLVANGGVDEWLCEDGSGHEDRFQRFDGRL
jgi:hypothetical protein